MSDVLAKHNQQFYWTVVYEDGSELEEKDTLFGDLIQDKIRHVIISHNAIPIFILHLSPPKRLIMFRRNRKTLNGKNIVTNSNVVFVIGWQETIRGVNTQSLCYIYPDGHIEMKDKI